MTRKLLTMLALAGVAACGGGGDRQDLATADSWAVTFSSRRWTRRPI